MPGADGKVNVGLENLVITETLNSLVTVHPF